MIFVRRRSDLPFTQRGSWQRSGEIDICGSVEFRLGDRVTALIFEYTRGRKRANNNGEGTRGGGRVVGESENE